MPAVCARSGENFKVILVFPSLPPFLSFFLSSLLLNSDRNWAEIRSLCSHDHLWWKICRQSSTKTPKCDLVQQKSASDVIRNFVWQLLLLSVVWSIIPACVSSFSGECTFWGNLEETPFTCNPWICSISPLQISLHPLVVPVASL